jgi:hypothetical protein
MLKASKKPESGRGPFRRLSDSETLLFVARTLNPRSSISETPDIFARLQSLRDILDHQEIDLLDWPDSPGKDRFYASLLSAKRLVAQIAGDLAESAAGDAANSRAESA